MTASELEFNFIQFLFYRSNEIDLKKPSSGHPKTLRKFFLKKSGLKKKKSIGTRTSDQFVLNLGIFLYF